MSSASASDPAPLLVPIDAGGGLGWQEWLRSLEADEPVVLSRPAAEYLHEARSAGEV